MQLFLGFIGIGFSILLFRKAIIGKKIDYDKNGNFHSFYYTRRISLYFMGTIVFIGSLIAIIRNLK